MSSTCSGCSFVTGGDSVMAKISHAAGMLPCFDRSTEQMHCSFPSASQFAKRRQQRCL